MMTKYRMKEVRLSRGQSREVRGKIAAGGKGRKQETYRDDDVPEGSNITKEKTKEHCEACVLVLGVFL